MAYLKGGGGDGGRPPEPHRAGDLRQQGRGRRRDLGGAFAQEVERFRKTGHGRPGRNRPAGS